LLDEMKERGEFDPWGKDSYNNNCFTFRITLHAKTIDTKTIES